MHSQTSGSQSLSDRKADYDLSVLYKQNSLMIQLLVKRNPCKMYRKHIQPTQMPPQLQFVGNDIHFLYQCFKFPYEVLLEQGAVKLQMHLFFKTRQIIKQVVIKLQQQQLTNQLCLRYRINNLMAAMQDVYTGSSVTFNDQPNQKQIKMQQDNIIKYDVIKQLEKSVQIIRQTIQLAADCLEQMHEKESKIIQNIHNINKRNLTLLKQNKQTINNLIRAQYTINQDSTKPKQIGSARAIESQKQIRIGNIRIVKYQENRHQQNQINPVIKIPPFLVTQQKNIQQIRAFQKNSGSKFNIQNNIIKYIGPSNESNQLVLKKNLTFKGRNSFKVKVKLTFTAHMYIGIIEKEKSRHERTNSVICYFGYDGQLWDDRPLHTIGSGFKINDVVEVVISKGQIVWNIQGKIQAKHHSDKLNVQNSTFYPFIQMMVNGDQIQWLQ